jgi:hypothetical protein
MLVDDHPVLLAAGTSAATGRLHPRDVAVRCPR